MSVAADTAIDLLDLYAPRTGFVMQRSGRGIAASAPPQALVAVSPGPDQVRRAATVMDEALTSAGAASVGFGALPFDGSPVSFLHIASDVVRIDGHASEDAIPAGYRLARSAPEPDEEAYRDAVSEALRAIDAGQVAKVVLARSLVIEADRLLDARVLAKRLRAADPDCYVFAAGLPGSAHALVGASPELLVRRQGDAVSSDPLAGTAARSADHARDAEIARGLLQAVKERQEHRLVAEAVADGLAPFCSDLAVDAEPSLTSTATVWHLHTSIRGRLRKDAPDALTLAAALHPTPAVCGTPRDAALELIRELEPFDRRFYAGTIGWVDAQGDGEWVIALRCAEIMGRTARLYAGSGIVTGSDPAAEDREVDVKFGAMLRALGFDQPAR
jgi:isochorismate synthase